MPRGFTLLELIIALMVAGVLLASAGPNLSHLYEQHKVRQLAEEFRGSFLLARSEAVLRNQDLNLRVKKTTESTETWFLKLWDKGNDYHYPSQYILWKEGSGLVVSPTVENDPDGAIIEFGKVNGKPTSSNQVDFYYRNNSDKTLRLVYSHISGRISLCGVGGEHYGYPQC